MRLRSILVAATAALALAACDRGDDGPVTLDGLNTDLKPYSGPMPNDPQGWSRLLATNDQYQIEAGKLAQSLSATPQVKSYGATIERFHTQLAAELEATAAQAGGVTVDKQLSPYQQSQLGKLRSAGPGFDAEFKQQMIAAQQEAVWLLQGFNATGTSPPLQAFAGKYSKAVEGHLAGAYALPQPQPN